jgi:hypothetical protein
MSPHDLRHFAVLGRMVSYAGADEMGTSTSFEPAIHMHFDHLWAANDKQSDSNSIINLIRAVADAQLQPSTDVDA